MNGTTRLSCLWPTWARGVFSLYLSLSLSLSVFSLSLTPPRPPLSPSPSEFNPTDSAEARGLKLQLTREYNRRLAERLRRRRAVILGGLLDIKAAQLTEKLAGPDERAMAARMRPFARYASSPDDHAALVRGLAAERALRARLAELCELRRVGVRTKSDADEFARRRDEHQLRGRAAEDRRRAQETAAAGLPLDRAARLAARGGGDPPVAPPTSLVGAPRELRGLLVTTQPSASAAEALAPPAPALDAWRAGPTGLSAASLPGWEWLDDPARNFCARHRVLPATVIAAHAVVEALGGHSNAGPGSLTGVAGLDEAQADALLDIFVSGGGVMREIREG